MTDFVLVPRSLMNDLAKVGVEEGLGPTLVNQIKAALSTAPASPVVGEDATKQWQPIWQSEIFEALQGMLSDADKRTLIDRFQACELAICKLSPALASIPTPTAGRAEALEECVAIAGDRAAIKLADAQKAKDSGDHTSASALLAQRDTALWIERKIRALSSAPTPQAVDDEMVERAMKAVGNLRYNTGAEYKKYIYTALTAAFPQRPEE